VQLGSESEFSSHPPTSQGPLTADGYVALGPLPLPAGRPRVRGRAAPASRGPGTSLLPLGDPLNLSIGRAICSAPTRRDGRSAVTALLGRPYWPHRAGVPYRLPRGLSGNLVFTKGTTQSLDRPRNTQCSVDDRGAPQATRPPPWAAVGPAPVTPLCPPCPQCPSRVQVHVEIIEGPARPFKGALLGRPYGPHPVTVPRRDALRRDDRSALRLGPGTPRRAPTDGEQATRNMPCSARPSRSGPKPRSRDLAEARTSKGGRREVKA
jgi:hypothetical protein